jgi:glycyl-tRNA synthetase beta subunit
MKREFLGFVQTLLESVKLDKFQEFLETRKKGAAKIAKSAQEKGGPSLLTAQHFKAKEVPYKKAIEHVSDETREKYYSEEAEKCLKKLNSWKTMTQKEFQTVMGELEVWGEVYIKSKGK